MAILDWLISRVRPQEPRIGKTITFDVTQDGNEVAAHGDGIEANFAVSGINLPANVDANFAVWGLLPRAMEEGFNLHLNRPIDPVVAENAARVSKIWETWVPNRYRSIKVSGEGGWSRRQAKRQPRVQLYSGGIDSTYSIWKNRDNGYAATVCGVDRTDEGNVEQLIAKTDPLLSALGYKRIVITTDVQREPSAITHAFTLAATLFLLSDLFDEGTLAADSTFAEDMATFPWGTNHVTNEYLAGSDFSVRTVGAEIARTDKIAAIIGAGLDPRALSFCRKRGVMPANCGTCRKCIRTKAMFLVSTGSIPEIFLDNSFNETLAKEMAKKFSERVHLFDIYHCARERGRLDKIPNLAALIEKVRALGAEEPHH
jgi:hypothetical protein